MKTHSPMSHSASALLSMIIVSSTSVVLADVPNSATLSNFTNSGYIIYKDSGVGTPSELVQTFDLNEAVNALSGNSSYAGGNIELYTKSDSESFANFTNADRVELLVDFGAGNQVTLSSLNGQNWFHDGSTYNTSYGANNLANQWFGDLVSELNNYATLQPLLDTPAELENLFNTYRNTNGFQQLSDPNVSYVEKNGSVTKVGLGGFIDVKPRFVQLAIDAGVDPMQANSIVPNGIQVSEVVLLDGVATYGFSATPSGVRYDDGVDSYNANYEVSNVPEPSSAVLIGLGSIAVILRRKRG